jgi:asparagine synthase (glutamine-hydrolysing)
VNPFLCVIDLHGTPLGTDALAAALPGLVGGDGRVGAVLHGSWAAAWVPSAALDRPAVAHRGSIVAVGNVRLSNRAALQAEPGARALTDLELVIERYAARGSACARELVGDFAFVLWDLRRGVAFAARDALGVKSLFYQRKGDRLTIASHVECFEQGDYDPEYLGQFLLGMPTGTDHTAFRNVTRLGAGNWLTVEAGRVRTEPYWSPTEFVPAVAAGDEQEAAAEFRRLFTAGVAAQLDDDVQTWAFLSGGLDSSSNVSVAAQLASAGAARPLAGTLTVVDSLTDGDETRFSNAVLGQYPNRNEQVVDYWAWQDDGEAFAALGEPHAFLPFSARDRQLNRVLREAGAGAVLSGIGSDQYLAGPPLYLADYVARGQWRTAARLVTDLAVSSRQSFWGLGWRNAIMPLLPRSAQQRWQEPGSGLPGWFAPRFVSQFGLWEKLTRIDVPPTGGGIWADQVAAEVGSIQMILEPAELHRGVELRYPFLHRPLVEFALALPPTLRARPGESKWVLREGLRGILPERVRARKGKGAIGARLLWSLNQESPTLRKLIRHSHLAELGCVNREQLAAGFEQAVTGNTRATGFLLATLALETWLAVRSGWWGRNRVRSQFTRLPSHAGSRSLEESSYEAAVC